MYKVEKYHFRPCYYRGDLDSENIMEAAPVFKTRKLAKEYVEKELRGLRNVSRSYKKVGTSWCYGFTNKEWVEENTGEKCTEYFEYKLMKL